jgi:predicted dienelactone hydrolase
VEERLRSNSGSVKRDLLAAVAVFVVCCSQAQAAPYPVRTIETITLHDSARQRDIPLKIYYPAGAHAAPLVLFSHGYGSDRDGYAYLAAGWASAGYVVILPTHEGGDRQAALAGGFGEILRGETVVTASQLEANARDLSLIISSLPEIVRQAPQLRGAIDSTRIGVAGHSMGAGTALVVAGATLPGSSEMVADPRPLAFIAISPQGMYSSADAHRWDAIARPTMTMYGSADSGEQHQPPSWRGDPFAHMPPPSKYNVVVDGANHFSFAEAAGSPIIAQMLAAGQTRSIAEIHAFVVRATLVFWDAYLKKNSAAEAALRSARTLDPADPIGAVTYK